MLYYYAFPIVLHFVLEACFVVSILGWGVVVEAILSPEFALVFLADFFLVIVILSDTFGLALADMFPDAQIRTS